MIEVTHLSKSFRLSRKQQKEKNTKAVSIEAVKNASFKVQPGRIFSLLGPNGAGKTTLLRILATILKPSQGEALVAGYSVEKESKEVRRNIGFLTGTTTLYERMTCNEIVEYFGKLYGMKNKEIQMRKEFLFEKLEIEDFENKKIGQLSTGMKQRVSLARAFFHNPKVLILDEPTSGLDVIASQTIIEFILEANKENKTIIFSSHILSEVDYLCDDLAIINKGEIIYNDTMDAFRKTMKTKTLTESFIQLLKSHSN